MSSIDENIKEFEEMEKKLIEEFNIRLELIKDDELKNLLLVLRDLILVWAGLSTAKSAFTLQKMLELRNELRRSKDFRDRYL
jgi:hypothetical protein